MPAPPKGMAEPFNQQNKHALSVCYRHESCAGMFPWIFFWRLWSVFWQQKNGVRTML